MKNKTIILAAVLGMATMAGCKKTYYINAEKINPGVSENYTHSDSYIKQNSWKIIQREDGDNGNIRKFKLNVVGTNNYIIINKVDHTKYWQTGFQLNDTITGLAVVSLMDYEKK